MAHISLTLVGLMWVLPFLYYYHAYPLTTFYQEWGAAILGLSAALLLLMKQNWVLPEVPRIVLLPVGLMLLALLQFLLGKTTYFDQTLLFSLYMLWVVLLLMLGRVLRQQMGLAMMVTVLATFLLLGSELNAVAGILQHFRWHTFLDQVVTSKNGIAVYGNMAQPNHYANYITLGLISLGLLRSHLRSWQMVLLALPLLFVLVLSGSRSSWLYLLGMAVMAFLWQRKDQSCRYLLYYTLLLLLGFGVMHWVTQLPWLNAATGSVTTVQRMMAGDTNGSVRLYLWHEAWLIFKQFPLLGAGLGQFAWQHFQLATVLQAAHINGLYNNAHNLVMQLAAELGLAGVMILLGTLGQWVRHNLRVQFTLYHWWGYAVLMVIGIHSMLEYPLWYAYFIGIAAILLGAFDNSTYRLELHRLGRISVVAVILLGSISLIQFQYGYGRLERAMVSRPVSAEDSMYLQRLREELMVVHAMPLLKPYAEIFMNNWFEVSMDNLDNKLELNGRSLQFVPLANLAYRSAMLLALSGKIEEACLQMERAIWSYPGDYPARRKELSDLAKKYPEKLTSLLEFANIKYEEYQNAVPAK